MDDSRLDGLWAEVIAGNEAAFADVHHALAPSICRYASRLIGSNHLGEEVAQEAFLLALRRARQYRGPGRLRYWLFGIAHRAALDALAREQKHHRPIARPEVAAETDHRPTVADEERRVLEAAVAELPMAERTVLLMRVHLELSFNDIARTLDIPLNTALGRMHMALRRLRENGKLQRYFCEELPPD